ncbi:MAG: 2-C-methyl-D-erythritol 4-phosphate cytidylyltransferase [Fastidiosipila sp.]|nr:2-C-methyl-D-erythritol 4-phosphate cytidylyltransferase [Fastidiosipila sp.]
MSKFQTYAVILAAGRGERMQADANKMLLEISGNSLLDLCLKRFQKNTNIDHIIAVIAPDDIYAGQNNNSSWLDCLNQKYPKIKNFVAGGKTRQDSVYNGLLAIKNSTNSYTGRVLVLIHDGARCFVPSKVLDKIISALKSERCAAVAALPVSDTIRQTANFQLQDLAVSRENLWQMQTPQAADLDIYLHAFELARKDGIQATDDIALLLRIGYPVRIVMGDQRNFKLTTPADFEMACLLYEAEYFKE